MEQHQDALLTTFDPATLIAALAAERGGGANARERARVLTAIGPWDIPRWLRCEYVPASGQLALSLFYPDHDEPSREVGNLRIGTRSGRILGASIAEEVPVSGGSESERFGTLLDAVTTEILSFDAPGPTENRVAIGRMLRNLSGQIKHRVAAALEKRHLAEVPSKP